MVGALTSTDILEHALQHQPEAAIGLFQHLGQCCYLGREQLAGRGERLSTRAQHWGSSHRLPGQYLVIDALQVHCPSVPEIELGPGQGVQPLQQ